jgi:tetratricopeptide (TPR) repeat protein
MTPALRWLGELFYAPARGIRQAGERGRLQLPIYFALLVQTVYGIFFNIAPPLLVVLPGAAMRWAYITVLSFFWSALSLAIVGLIFVPAVIVVSARWFGGTGVLPALQRDYPRMAPAAFGAVGVAYIWGLGLAIALRTTGALGSIVRTLMPAFEQGLAADPSSLAKIGPIGHGEFLAAGVLQLVMIPGLIWALWSAVRAGFGLSRGRAVLVTAVGCLALMGFDLLMLSLPGALVAAPLLMVMSFIVLRANFLAALERQRVMAAFDQAVTTADRSPFDPRAQYDLGMLLLGRGETGQASARFERTVAQDPQDLDAHFQLGRIARIEGRWAEAIRHFEPVVENDFAHAHYEIWREVGATYLGAGQFADAVSALERFLDHRPHDAEGWYLLGQAQDGLGNNIEAAAAMHACLAAIDGTTTERDERLRELHMRAAAYLTRERK